jgi:hypothetical protein
MRRALDTRHGVVGITHDRDRSARNSRITRRTRRSATLYATFAAATRGRPSGKKGRHDLKDRFNRDAGEDFLPMREAMRALGVSRQTVLQRVKHGELAAVHVMRGKQKDLRIKVIGRQPNLFDAIS